MVAKLNTPRRGSRRPRFFAGSFSCPSRCRLHAGPTNTGSVSRHAEGTGDQAGGFPSELLARAIISQLFRSTDPRLDECADRPGTRLLAVSTPIRRHLRCRAYDLSSTTRIVWRDRHSRIG